FRPKLAVFLEKEIWPNLFAALGQQAIPLYVINARLSARSARAYRKIPALVKPALAQIKLIATQTEADKNQFLSIGASDTQLAVLGNIKFDITIAPEVLAEGKQLKQQWGQRFVWIIASTHQGEEAQLLAHYPRLKAQIPQLLVVIAPRHPERFAAVKIGCEKQGLRVVMRSEQTTVTQDCDVYLADSMGELKMLLAAADVAFVGGSLVDVGGHNVLEPAAAGVPVLFGPIMFNFQLIAEQMLAHQAARQCQDAAAVADAVLALAADPELRQRLAAKASAFLAANQGAIERIVAVLTPFPL
ncbi:MAG: 3-deoxy-D-manno-octulosonic acid transferase, partial [Methylococcaceae bacterium]|nr:3-deoxy-D-manno-octulosonic acid transferase [Methylococcaceae bacterium]